MATRENLNKLNVYALRELASDCSINTEKKRKQELINEILNCQISPSILTPVVLQASENQAIIPNTKENLPPFNKVSYDRTVPLLPNISFSMIYEFMVTRTTESGTCANNFKGLDRAVKHYDAGDVQDIAFKQVDDTTVYVKAHCQASMKKHKYQVYVCLSLRPSADSCTIDYAFCQCPVGLAQACSHVGGLLIALSNARSICRDDKDDKSCTSLPCQWKVPRSTVKPQPLKSLKQSKPKLVNSNESSTDVKLPPPQTNFDPRHTDDRVSDLSSTLRSLRDLKDVFPTTGMSLLWHIPDHVPDAYQEVELATAIDPMYQKMEKMLFTENNLSLLEIDGDLVQYIEHQTRQQRVSEMWRKLHIGRLTSSLFADALNAKDQPKSLVRTIVEGSSLDRYAKLPDAVQWGVDNEDNARADYIQLNKMANDDFSVKPTGLTLCSTHSFLGASSDGKVTDGNDTGLLEIKCPFSVDGLNVCKMEVPDILALNSKHFCLVATERGPSLQKTHKYYAQVQGEMAIMGMPWCDFVVWTGAPKNNMSVDRIYFDSEFVTSMMPKLVKFYLDHIFPIFYK